MENQKWLRGLIYAVSLVSVCTASFEAARKVGERAVSQQPAIITTTVSEQPTYFAPVTFKPASSDFDLTVKQYYFNHASEFVPQSHSPGEQAKALRFIQDTLRQNVRAAHQA